MTASIKTQLTRLAELCGKTIAPDGVKESGGDLLCFHFTDGSFIIFHASSDGSYGTVEPVTESLERFGFFPYQLRALGVLDAEGERQMIEDVNRKAQAAIEQAEHEQLEKLLKKYGSSPK